MKSTFVFILTTILSGCFFKNKEIKDFPSFSFLLKDSTTIFQSKNIPNDKPFLMIYFSPDCGECQHETATILENMKSLQNVNFYFLTNDPFDRLRVFNRYYKIYNYKNITLGWDNQYGFIKNFHPSGMPHSILFDKNKKAQAVFVGEMQPDILLSKLKNL